MSAEQGLAKLREEILAEASRQAADEIHAAEEAAKAEQAQAQAATEREREAILQQARQQAEALRRRAASIAEVEAKKRLLDVREQLIRQVLEEAAVALRKPLPPKEQRELLLRLIVEAAQEAEGGRLDVHVAPGDRPLLAPDLLDEAQRELAGRGVEAKLAPTSQPLPVASGVLLTKDEGRLLVDNSLEARLRRREPALRAEIWRILAESMTTTAETPR